MLGRQRRVMSGFGLCREAWRRLLHARLCRISMQEIFRMVLPIRQRLPKNAPTKKQTRKREIAKQSLRKHQPKIQPINKGGLVCKSQAEKTEHYPDGFALSLLHKSRILFTPSIFLIKAATLFGTNFSHFPPSTISFLISVEQCLFRS